MELVTSQVTTPPGNSRHSATWPDAAISPTCGTSTKPDVIRQNGYAW